MPEYVKKQKIQLKNVRTYKNGWTHYDAVMPSGAIMRGKSKNTLKRIEQDLEKVSDRRSKLFTAL